MEKEELLKKLENAKDEIKRRVEANNENKEDNMRLRLIEALIRSIEIPTKDKDGNDVMNPHLDSTLKQRLNGIEGAGSWYEGMTEEELLDRIILGDTELKEYNPEGAWPGCAYLKLNIPGKNGIRFIDDLPKESPLYLSIVHRGTGRFSVETTEKVQAIDEKETTIILGEENGVGEVLFTLHPGDEVRPSPLTIEALLSKFPELNRELEGKDGQTIVLQITREQAKALGFDMAKLTSDAMGKKLEESSIDVRNINTSKISLSEIRDRAVEKE